MLDKTLMIYPSVAMFALTMGLLLYMGWCRYRAIHRREVSIRFFRQYNEGEQTPRLHLLSRHIQNHFEVPPLMHLAVVLTYATDQVTVLSLTLAWSYVALRVAHSMIHLGSNNVSVRFFCFGASLLALTGLWAALVSGLVAA